MQSSSTPDSPDTASLADDAPPSSTRAPSPASELPLVDPSAYRVEGEYARGGLGRVLLAYDARLRRTVALKEILSPSPSAVARFVREARITARLQHPAIVPVYESGRWPTGEPFYAMRLVRGRSLADVVRNTHGLAERLALVPNLVAVADALAYAHAQRVIHRDLKPGNVLLGAFGETVVIDWGLAKDLAARTDEDLAFSGDTTASAGDVTVDGAVLGTPAYMAPEQARGEALDERADVYALGALVYFTLAGVAPHAGDTAQEVIARRERASPTPLEARARDVPLDLATVVRKAMAARPDERYPTAREFAEDLRRFQTGQLVSARRYSRWTFVGRWLARHRAVVGVATLAAASLGVVGGLSLRRVLRERNRAEQALARADARSDALVLLHAQSALERDPTAALAWLRLYPPGAADPIAAWNVAVEAQARGVARHVLATAEGTALDLAFAPDGATLVTTSVPRPLAWDLARGTLRATPALPRVVHLALRDDGSMLVGDSFGAVTRVARSDAAPVELFRQDGEVRALAVSADGRYAAVTGQHPEFHVIALPSGAPRAFAGHAGTALDVALARDGGELVSAGADGTVRAWDLAAATSRVLWTHRGPAGRVALSPDGRTVASGGDDGAVRLGAYADATETTARTLTGSGRPIRALVFSPDGALVAAADADAGFRVWRVATGERCATEVGEGQVRGLAFSPDGRYLASTSADETLRLWDPTGDGGAVVLRGHQTLDGPVAFSRDGALVATLGGDGTARVWPVPAPSRTLRSAGQWIHHVVFSPDGRSVATDGADRTVRLWDVESGRGRVLGAHGGTVYGLSFSRDGRYLASAGFDGRVGLWDLAAGTARMLDGHRGPVREVAFSPTSSQLASAGSDGSVRLWDPARGAARVFAESGDAVRTLEFAPDGRTLASFGQDRALRVRDVSTGEARALATSLGAASEGSFRATFSPDGAWVASCAGGDAVALWSVSAGTSRRWRVPSGSTRCTRLAFSPDGRLLALPVGNELQLLDVRAGTWRALRGHAEEVHHFHFSADGRFVVTASVDRTARAWELATGAAQVVHRHDGPVLDAAFSPDGRYVATASADGTAWVGRFDAARGLRPDPAAVRARIDALTTAVIVNGRARTPAGTSERPR